MFRSVFILFLLLSCLNLSLPAGELPRAKPEEVGMSSEKLAQVNQAMQQQVDQGEIPGGIVIVARKGKVVFFEAYGKRDQAADLPMERETIVRIYSMTKGIVTAAAMMLVDAGKLNPAEPASTYVPVLADVKVWTPEGLVAPHRPITVADLMRHTAGFGSRGDDPVGKLLNEADLSNATDLNDYAKRLAGVPLAYHPGEQWIYSNSIDVLGLVVQNVSGKPLGEFLQERLLGPLMMTDTAFYVPLEKRNRFAVCYEKKEGKLQPMQTHRSNEHYYEQPAVESGGGGLVSTAADYMQFLLMIANGGEWNGRRYLSPEAITMMTSDQLPPQAFPIRFGSQIRYGTGYSFGFNVRTADTEWDPAAKVGEYGWGGAASTHYWVSPKDEGLIVVTLEQVMPYSFQTEWLVKPLVYQSIER
ncbi:MAG: beta-lactamase family protein [Planctomycetaceae bacterium]|nr:beta-lactamase family protein [Planctomycetaceae bacterium]